MVTSNAKFQVAEDDVKAIGIGELKTSIHQLGPHPNDKIWLVGGGKLAAYCLENELVDELVIGIIPVTIGTGIPWIENHRKDVEWDLKEKFLDGDIPLLVYRRGSCE